MYHGLYFCRLSCVAVWTQASAWLSFSRRPCRAAFWACHFSDRMGSLVVIVSFFRTHYQSWRLARFGRARAHLIGRLLHLLRGN